MHAAKMTALIGLSAQLLLLHPSNAADYPSRPIKLLVGASAGGTTDTMARTIAEPLSSLLAKPVLVENRPGAGGNLAAEAVARSAPDGYTFLLGTAATHGVNAALYKKLPFDVEDDFTPISTLVDVSNVLTINPKVIDATSVQDFIAQVKANPGKYNYASTGNGTGTHLAFAEFNAKAGLDMVHVPYKGGPDAIQSVLKGDTCCIFNQVQTVLPQVKAGTVRLLGVTTKKRVAAIPGVPTIDEAGVPGVHFPFWHGLWAPKGIPADVLAKLSAAVVTALADSAAQKRFHDLGHEVAPREQQNPEALAAYYKAETDKWWPIIKAANLKAQ